MHFLVRKLFLPPKVFLCVCCRVAQLGGESLANCNMRKPYTNSCIDARSTGRPDFVDRHFF